MKLWVLLVAVVLASLEDLLFDDLDREMVPSSPSSPKSSQISMVSANKKTSNSGDSTSDSASSTSSASEDLSGANPLSNLAGGDDDNQDLQEFTPIIDQIHQSETRYYSFSVNTTSGVGSVYQFLIFLSGNVCSQPFNVMPDDRSLTVYYSFNSSVFSNLELGTMIEFDNGYFQAITEVPRANDSDDDDDGTTAPMPSQTQGDKFDVLYIAVRAPENTNRTASWTYQIGVSQNDLVFQWDDRQWAQLVDADKDSALIVTGNLTTNNTFDSLNVNSSQYSLLIFPATYGDKFASLNSSWCAVRNTPPLFESSVYRTSYTSRNGFLQQQFFVPGLNASTRYLAYLLSSFKGKDYGGAVYQPFEFETMSSDACKLIYDLEFCKGVSYSVPNNPQYSRAELRKLYDDQASSLYQNFSKALQQVACNTSDETRFSPIVNCGDCDASYRDWLCSVTLPRCTTNYEDFYVFRDLNSSRSDFINSEVAPPKPYYEIMPCIDNCNALVRDCPAQFKFQCPTRNQSIVKSYYFYDRDSEVPTCNLVSHNLLWVINEEHSSAGGRSRPSIMAIVFAIAALWAVY